MKYDYAFNFDDPEAIYYVSLCRWGFEAVAQKYNVELIKASDGAILGVSFPDKPSEEIMEDVKRIILQKQKEYIATK